MNDDERRNPDELLEAVKREESQGVQGRLKIFIGMSAGVGKTCEMLEEAQDLRRVGADVVVGIVDTHGRQDTAALLEGLKVIPEQTVQYKGREFKELDLDAVLRLQPQVVLVDELAHSNVPGLRHAKRWQDVIEILDNGIDVYTTLNIQHIESLNDTIKGITDISVRETVPDLLIEQATAIECIDITPDELLQRLRDGKVYLGDQSQLASRHFFQRDRLAALREIVLRYSAEKVDRDLRNSIPTSESIIKWKPREKFLVAVSHSPHSQKLIRTTRRLAYNANAPWIALYVNSGQLLSEEQTTRLEQNLQLARELGAEVTTINDPDIVEGIQRIARQKGITQIILGRTPPRPFLDLFGRHTLADTLSTACTDVDLHIIRQERLSVKNHRKTFSFPFQIQYTPYILVLLYVCALTGINIFFSKFIDYQIIGFIFLVGILSLSLFFKKGPIFFGAVLCALAWDFLFIPPVGQFSIDANGDVAMLILYLLTATVTGVLVDRAREHKEMLAKSEASIRRLYDIGQQIALSQSINEMLKIVNDQLKKSFNGDFNIIGKKNGDGIVINETTDLITDEMEKGAARWTFNNGKESGWSTSTLSACKNLYIPLKGFHKTVGILIFRPKTNKLLSPEEKNFLYTICRQLASHFERVFSEEKIKQEEQLKRVENTYKIVLDRLAHEFSSPLNVVKHAIMEWENKIALMGNPKGFQEVYEVEKSFDVFRNILNNISAMSQLSEGMITVEKGIHKIQEVIEECCNSVKQSQDKHEIKVIIENNLPQVSFDFHLIQMLLYNLIINAIEYSNPLSAIEIEAKTGDGFLILSVTDQGKGIPEDQLEAIFEKFYRLPEATTPGVGLGLSIAKTIAEIHHGHLKAENLSSGGVRFSLFLPLQSSP